MTFDFEFCSTSTLSCSFEFVVVGVGGSIPNYYFVSTQLQLWLHVGVVIDVGL